MNCGFRDCFRAKVADAIVSDDALVTKLLASGHLLLSALIERNGQEVKMIML